SQRRQARRARRPARPSPDSALANARSCVADAQLRVVGDLDAHVGEREAVDRAGDAADLLLTEHDGRLGVGPAAGHVEHPQTAVDLAAVVLPRDRLLPGIAALREGDRTLLEPCLGG